MPGWQQTAGRLLALALAQPAALAGTRLVCLEGPTGAGKTSLAAALEDAAARAGRSATVVHMDDVYEGWSGLDDAGDRLRRTVIDRIGQGRPGEFRRYDWHAARLDGLVRVPPSALLVVEGVGSGHVGYADRISLLVWVDAPPDVRRTRGVARDGEVFAARWDAWAASERALHHVERSRERADVVVDGRTGRISPAAPGAS